MEAAVSSSPTLMRERDGTSFHNDRFLLVQVTDAVLHLDRRVLQQQSNTSSKQLCSYERAVDTPPVDEKRAWAVDGDIGEEPPETEGPNSCLPCRASSKR